ncbi:MAG: tetratricopeptide repeat protein [Planctomycetota bacterium]
MSFAVRRIGWLARLVVVVVATAAALTVGEILVRLTGLAPGFRPIVVDGEATVYTRSSNRILGFELKADYRNDAADLRRNYPSTNSHGQRDIERSIPKPPGTKRIILLGDSVVEGVRLREINDLMSRQLELLYANESIEVLNFGVTGYCTRAEVELLKVKGLQFQPDIVVLVFTDNDFENYNHEAFRLGATAKRPEIVKSLFVGSHLFRLSCVSLNLFQFGVETEPMDWNRRAIGDNNVTEGLALFSELAKSYGFEPFIAIWPLFLDDKIVDPHPMPGNADQLVIERLGQMQGIKTVRLSRYFQQHRASIDQPVNPNRYYTVGDRLHPSKEGCRVAARVLKTILDDPQMHRQAGVASATSRRTTYLDAEAITAAKAKGKKKTDYSLTYKNAGNALKAEGKVDEAIGYYRQALEIKPDYAEAHYSLGNALLSQNKLADAVSHFREALRIRPDFAKAHSNLGCALYKAGMVDAAAFHFGEALRIMPNLTEARHNLVRLQGE